MDATDKGHIISHGFGSPHMETRYVETKHKWNIGVEALSMKTHIINI
jgi:hypothetical protein